MRSLAILFAAAVLLSGSMAAAQRSITNTETVHALGALGTRVVACTEGGLDLFDAGTGRFLRTLHVEDGLPSHFCRALERVGDELYVATDGGVIALAEDLSIRQVLPVAWHGLPRASEDASPSAYEALLRRWAGALDGKTTWTAFSARHAGTADGRVYVDGTALVRTVPGAVRWLDDSGEVLHIGSSEGRFTSTAAGLVERPSPEGPLHFTEDGAALGGNDGRTAQLDVNGSVFFGTANAGVHFEARGRIRRVTPGGQLCGNHVTAIATWRGRRVVGTFDRGLCWESNGKWTRVRAPALPSDQVYDLAADGDRLFVATAYGLGYFDGSKWVQIAYGGRNPIGLRKLSVLAVETLKEGVAVVDGSGVSIVSRGKKLELLRRIDAPTGWARHMSVATVTDDAVWLASEDRGIARFDGQRWRRHHDGRDLTDNWVTAISADEEGRAIVGSCLTGFAYFDGAAWTRIPAAAGLQSPMVTAVALTSGGAWVGTLAGAARFDAATGSLVALTGLADPRVYAIHQTGTDLWFGTEGGVTVARP